MVLSPRGWLMLPRRVQQADHIGGIVCAILPAPGRSCNVLRSQELAVAEGGMVSPLNAQAVVIT